MIARVSEKKTLERYRQIIRNTDNKDDLRFFLRGYFILKNESPPSLKELTRLFNEEVEHIKSLKGYSTMQYTSERSKMSANAVRRMMDGETKDWTKIMAALILLNRKHINLLP